MKVQAITWGLDLGSRDYSTKHCGDSNSNEVGADAIPRLRVEAGTTLWVSLNEANDDSDISSKN